MIKNQKINNKKKRKVLAFYQSNDNRRIERLKKFTTAVI